MRGKGTSAKDMPCAVGITPACAGKRGGRTVSFFLIRDHPRVCGEKKVMPKQGRKQEGSPPRVRGKVARRGLAFSGFGITPACAGKSSSAKMQPTTRWDHPRVCGEKSLLMKLMCFMVGSPPRVRGKVVYAHPGHTSKRDHPRVCGEKIVELVFSAEHPGSPPRVRGKD